MDVFDFDVLLKRISMMLMMVVSIMMMLAAVVEAKFYDEFFL